MATLKTENMKKTFPVWLKIESESGNIFIEHVKSGNWSIPATVSYEIGEADNPPQSVEVMTLEECKDKIAKQKGFSDWKDLLKHQLTFNLILRDQDQANSLYTSQFKTKSDSLQLELEQVKAERDAMRGILWEIKNVLDNFNGIIIIKSDDHFGTSIGKALQSTKQQ